MTKIKNIFSTIALVSAMVLIPVKASAYPSNEMTDMVTDVATEPHISVDGQQIKVEINDNDSHQVLIYALTGQIVKSEKAEAGVTYIELPRGYYIVKVDKVAKRIIIR